MEFKLTNSWNKILQTEIKKAYFKKLQQFLELAYKNEVIYPKQELIFQALNLTDLSNCKVVIVGQDPYHGPNQAHGLAFSVQNNCKTPPSLKNILKEVENSTNFKKSTNDLSSWAKQGVLLLNSILTVKANSPQSHSKIGWQNFTDELILNLNNKKTPIVFLLWGQYALSKQKLINNKNHLILKAAHPSPLSAHRGFFGCNHFKLANKFLASTNQTTINWAN